MHQWYRHVCASLVLTVYGFVGSGLAQTSDFVSGRITPRIDGNTLILFYDLTLIRVACDSIAIELPVGNKDDSGSYPDESVLLILRPNVVDKEDSLYGLQFRGEVRSMEYGRHVKSRYALRLYRVESDTLAIDTGLYFDGLAFYPDGVGARRGHVGLGFSTRSGFSDPIRSNSKHIIYRIEDLWGYNSRYYGIFVGYSFNHSSRFTLSEYIRVQAEFVPLRRKLWWPVFLAATTYTRVRGSKGTAKFVKKGLGVEAGLSIKGRLESVNYSYSTAAGGYHRAELFVATELTGHRIGTKYSLFRGKYVRMFSITMSFDIEDFSDNRLGYRNRRPFIHKALALVGFIPLLPMALAMRYGGS